MSDRPRFPDFLHGGYRSLQRRLGSEGKKWAAQRARTGSYPNPSVVEVPRGEVVITAEIADFERLGAETPRWRLYFVNKLASAITDKLESDKWDAARHDFEAHTIKSSWGALDWAIEHSSPNSLAAVSSSGLKGYAETDIGSVASPAATA